MLNHLVGVLDDLVELLHYIIIKALETLLFVLVEKVLYFFVEFFELLHYHVEDTFVLFELLGLEVALPIIVVEFIDVLFLGVDHRVKKTAFLIYALS